MGSRIVRLGRGWLVVAALVLAAVAGVPGAHTQEEVAEVEDGGMPPALDWEATGLSGPVGRLWTPRSGAFFAAAAEGLARSDDGGQTWRVVPMPPRGDERGAPFALPDPVQHTTLYARGAGGLYVSEDDARSWRVVYPFGANRRVVAMAVSPADTRVLYLALSDASLTSELQFLRSRDRGATWQVVEEAHPTLCFMAFPVLLPDPLDAARVHRVANCYAGRTLGDVLQTSADQALTWSARLFPPSDVDAAWRWVYLRHLLHGGAVMPERRYLAAHHDARLRGGAGVFRSDDGGATWSLVLEQAETPNDRVAAMALDPTAPDRVYVAMAGQDRGVLASADGGATWQSVGRADIGQVTALAVGVDGRNLYAATDGGLLRLRLEGAPVP